MQCSVFIAMSLDGYIAGSDGSLAWLEPFQAGGNDYGYAKFAASCDAMVMGRGTYDFVLGFPQAPSFGMPLIVMTHREAPPRDGVELFAGTATQLVGRLRERGVRRAYIDGGNVIRPFLAANLVDDRTVSVIPVLLGAGRPLFGGPTAQLELETVERWPNGLAQLRYRVKRV